MDEDNCGAETSSSASGTKGREDALGAVVATKGSLHGGVVENGKRGSGGKGHTHTHTHKRPIGRRRTQ